MALRLVSQRKAPGAFLCVWALLLGACGPSPAPVNDGFRAKLAMGCASRAACDALAAEADARAARCVRDGDGDGCGALMADRGEAARLQQQRTEADDRAREAQAASDAEQRQADVARAQAQSAAAAKCRDYASTAESQMRFYLGKKTILAPPGAGDDSPLAVSAVAHRADPGAEFRKDEAEARQILRNLTGCDEALAARLLPEVDAWASRWTQAIAEEEACRASPQCRADRIAVPLCEAVLEKQNALADIARERRNPAGVVDLTWLHDLGERVEEHDETIRELRPKYEALAHHPFNPRACPKNP